MTEVTAKGEQSEKGQRCWGEGATGELGRGNLSRKTCFLFASFLFSSLWKSVWPTRAFAPMRHAIRARCALWWPLSTFERDGKDDAPYWLYSTLPLIALHTHLAHGRVVRVDEELLLQEEDYFVTKRWCSRRECDGHIKLSTQREGDVTVWWCSTFVQLFASLLLFSLSLLSHRKFYFSCYLYDNQYSLLSHLSSSQLPLWCSLKRFFHLLESKVKLHSAKRPSFVAAATVLFGWTSKPSVNRPLHR